MTTAEIGDIVLLKKGHGDVAAIVIREGHEGVVDLWDFDVATVPDAARFHIAVPQGEGIGLWHPKPSTAAPPRCASQFDLDEAGHIYPSVRVTDNNGVVWETVSDLSPDDVSAEPPIRAMSAATRRQPETLQQRYKRLLRDGPEVVAEFDKVRAVAKADGNDPYQRVVLVLEKPGKPDALGSKPWEFDDDVGWHLRQGEPSEDDTALALLAHLLLGPSVPETSE